MRSTRQKSQAQEKSAAKLFGGITTKGSGNGWKQKNDVITDSLSMELKYTDKKSYSLKHEDLIVAEQHALLDGRTVVFGVSFSGDEWLIIRPADLAELIEGSS